MFSYQKNKKKKTTERFRVMLLLLFSGGITATVALETLGELA